jgi:hypothetical protein
MGKKNKKKERTTQRFTMDLHSETLSSFSFFLIGLIQESVSLRQLNRSCYQSCSILAVIHLA